MSGSVKKSLMRSSALVVGAAMVTCISQPAKAVTINSVGAPVVDSFVNGTCRVRISVNLTGVTNDVSNLDRYATGYATSSGPVAGTVGVTALQVGQTATLNLAAALPSSTGRDDYSFVVYDTGPTFTVGNFGPIAASVPINRSALIAAGGNCALVAPNIAPIADAGTDQNLSTGGAAISLDASGSTDGDGDPLIYSWTQVSGPSNIALAGASTAAPTFTAPAQTNQQQDFVFEVTTNDGLETSTDQVTISIVAGPNSVPVADAGPDQTVPSSQAVTLDGSGSTDPDGDTLTYSWAQVSGPTVSLNNASSATPDFTAPLATAAAQALEFELTVDDGFTSAGARALPSNPSVDRVIITVAPNASPVANAGADQGPIDSGQTVTLDGSASTDPENDTLTYSWTQISGTTVSLTGGTSSSPTFVAPLVNGNEDLVFSLVVSDGQVDSVADTVTIGIRAVGSITIIQRIIGGDTPVTFTSNIAALNGIVTTANGTGQLTATSVAAGSYAVTAADLTSSGFAITDITCDDTDSVANVSGRTVAIELAPNEDLVCTFTTANSREAASSAIADFLTGRNALIMSHQPDLQRRLDRLEGQAASPGTATAFGMPVPGSGALPFSMSLANGQASASTSLATMMAATGAGDRAGTPFDVWAEAFFTKARLGTQRANFRIVHVGADYRISDNLLIGALAEFDDFSDRGDLEAGEAEGNGWLVGPYVMARVAPGLFAEVRAGWGKSDNRVSPLGTYVDDFTTSRKYVSGSLVGQFEIGKATNIRPEFTVRYLDEKQKAYTDSLNVVIPGQSVSQGDVSFRPRVQHSVKLDHGWILRPFGEVEGIYTFGTETNSVLQNGLRARIESGVDLIGDSGFRASLGAFHDGIGADNYRSSGVHVSVSFGF